MKILLIILLLIIIISLIIFSYRNTHWYNTNLKNIKKAHAIEKQITLPNGNIINYGEVINNKPPLLLIHGQMSSWQDYANLLPQLSINWHIYAIDVYGHGKSSHHPDLYYLDVFGNDLIWFIDNVIQDKTVVSGHSNGAITAAYIAAYGSNVSGVVLEDPPIFSTEGDDWENSFAYLDTYQPLHNYLNDDQGLCWPAYYLKHCYWGKLFMKKGTKGLSNYAQKYYLKHPTKEVKIFFLPKSITGIFHYVNDYDFIYGERFYDLSWNHGYHHSKILSNINVPCLYLHAKEGKADTGVYLCASSNDQTNKAVSLIKNCTLIETPDSNHVIHSAHKKLYINTLNEFLEE